MEETMTPYIVAALIVFFILTQVIKIMSEYERGVIFRLGRLIASKGPGIIFIIPFVDRLMKVSLRLIAFDVPPQDVITKDNVSIKVNAVLYYRVLKIMPMPLHNLHKLHLGVFVDRQS
jgi:regulator of protease activity HflC (stomatin/prohibitin superfamily)